MIGMNDSVTVPTIAPMMPQTIASTVARLLAPAPLAPIAPPRNSSTSPSTASPSTPTSVHTANVSPNTAGYHRLQSSIPAVASTISHGPGSCNAVSTTPVELSSISTVTAVTQIVQFVMRRMVSAPLRDGRQAPLGNAMRTRGG